MKAFAKIISSRIVKLFLDKEKRYALVSVLVIISISTFLLAINITGTTYKYSENDIAKENISAPKDIHFEDIDQTEIKRLSIASSTSPVFDRDTTQSYTLITVVNRLFNHIESVLIDNPPYGTSDYTFQLAAVKNQVSKDNYLKGTYFSDNLLVAIMKSNKRTRMKKMLKKIIAYIYDNRNMGILRKYSNPLNLNSEYGVIRPQSNLKDEYKRKLSKVLTIQKMKKVVYGVCYTFAPDLSANDLRSMSLVIQYNLRSNIVFNKDETEKRKNLAIEKVEPVIKHIKKGRVIVQKGIPISSESLKLIKIINSQAQTSNFSYILGIFFIQLIFIFILAYFILEYESVFIPDKQSTMVILTILLFFMTYTYFISRTSFIKESELLLILFLPIPFVTIILSILYNVYLAMLSGLFIVFFSTIINGDGANTAIISVAFSSALLGVYINANVQRRTDFLRGGFILGALNSLIIITLVLTKDLPSSTMLENIQLAFVSGILNSILALGLLPLYESMFGVMTKFKLLELSDLNADIFKDMLLNAPGTYNHSLLVSTLSEAACKDVNANYLLARVGAFYHDIGKIEDAGMFIENKITDPRAKRFSAREYSELILSHVDKGVKVARDNDLPEAIIDFIREHHGKTTMAYFYHQALQEANAVANSDEIIKENFKYRGPMPHSRETAIVMLADAVEAASRSIFEPTFEKLEGLVQKIIYNKLNEGELDNSQLSMADLKKIQNSFLTILTGIFHSRIEYPDEESVIKLEEQAAQDSKNKSNNKKQKKKNGQKLL